MKTIAIVNLKGGVGKTVTAVNMAAVLASDRKQRVLLVDADSQCNATEFFGGEPKDGNLADLLLTTGCPGGFSPELHGTSLIQATALRRLDLLAASDALMDLDLSKIEQQSVNSAALRDLTIYCAEMDLYDYIIIDCPPAFSAASAAALLAADEVIIPIKLDAFSLRGMANLTRQIANMRRINPRLRIAGCLITMYRTDDSIDAAVKQLRSATLPVFDTVIRHSSKVDGMTFAQRPLLSYSPRSGAGVDYRRFVREYCRMGGASHG